MMRPWFPLLLLTTLPVPSEVAAQQVPNPVSKTQTYAFPSGAFEELTSITVNPPYPPAAQLTPGVTGLTSKMVVPGTATQTPHPNSPMTAWMKSYNSTAGNSSTAYFGGSFSGADGANPYGMTLTVCNCDGFGAVAGTGHNFQNQIGFEVDIESLSLSGGLAPTGQQVAFLAVSASDIQPAGGSIAYAVRDQGTGGGFSYPFYSEDGAGLTAGLRLGAQTLEAAGPAAHSQAIEFRARTAGVTTSGTLQYQQGGNFVFQPATANGVITSTGHYGSNAPAVAVTACGTSPVVDTSNDTRGLVTVGAGTVTACTVTFGTAYAQTPTCVVGLVSNGTATAVGFSNLQPDFMVLSFTGNAAAQKFSYMCMQ